MGTIKDIRKKFGQRAGDLALKIGMLQELRDGLKGREEKRDIDESIMTSQREYEQLTGVPYAYCRGYRE